MVRSEASRQRSDPGFPGEASAGATGSSLMRSWKSETLASRPWDRRGKLTSDILAQPSSLRPDQYEPGWKKWTETEPAANPGYPPHYGMCPPRFALNRPKPLSCVGRNVVLGCCSRQGPLQYQCFGSRKWRTGCPPSARPNRILSSVPLVGNVGCPSWQAGGRSERKWRRPIPLPATMLGALKAPLHRRHLLA
jgi:hypothetical protein